MDGKTLIHPSTVSESCVRSGFGVETIYVYIVSWRKYARDVFLSEPMCLLRQLSLCIYMHAVAQKLSVAYEVYSFMSRLSRLHACLEVCIPA